MLQGSEQWTWTFFVRVTKQIYFYWVYSSKFAISRNIISMPWPDPKSVGVRKSCRYREKRPRPMCWLFFFYSKFLSFPDNNPFTCDKRCNKKRTCGMHKCSKTCCVVRLLSLTVNQISCARSRARIMWLVDNSHILLNSHNRHSHMYASPLTLLNLRHW